MNDDTISRQMTIDAVENCEPGEELFMIKSLPSAQLEIIRCKDCMHNGSYDTDCPIDWNGKEYCSFAERRTDEGSN